MYGLGAILYEMLTGRPPFTGTSASETLHRVIHDEPVRPRQVKRSIPRDLETICLRCLEKDPVRRLATARQVAEELERDSRRRSARGQLVPSAGPGAGVVGILRSPSCSRSSLSLFAAA